MVCLKCGDEGFSDTFVFCDKCQVYALHRYCLDGPVNFYDDVTWLCEDCEPHVIEKSFHYQCILPSRVSDSSNSAKDASQGKSDVTNYVESVKDNNNQQQNIAAKRNVMLSDCHSVSNHAQSQSINNYEEEEKLKEDCQSVPIVEDNSSEGFVTVHDPYPIVDPTWRGSWCFSNQSSDTFTGLFAHLSTLACPKVLEETRLFPEVLSANLLPRSAVWPKGFSESGPNDESIALYFFPESESVERAYDNLVDDMISHDLGIKAMIKNAELLVFPSTVLPIKHRRFQAKYYLWGVFRAKQAVLISP